MEKMVKEMTWNSSDARYDRFSCRAISTMHTPKTTKTIPWISCIIISTSNPIYDCIKYLNYTKGADANASYGQCFYKRINRLLHIFKHTLGDFVLPFKRLVNSVEFFGNHVHSLSISRETARVKFFAKFCLDGLAREIGLKLKN